MHLRRVEEDPQEPLPALLPGEKVVVFVRHGQSIANTLAKNVKKSPLLCDSKLTPLGETQAATLRGQRFGSCAAAVLSRPQLIVSSPLSRALQTACLAFERLPLPIVAWPMCTEFYEQWPENRGRPREQLETDAKLLELAKWRDVDLTNAAGDWWCIAADVRRLGTFLGWLRICPETRIVVVSHYGFITYLLEHAGYTQRAHLSLHNCAQVRTVWHPEPLEQPLPIAPEASAPSREYSLWLEPDRTAPSPFLVEFDAFAAAVPADPQLRGCTFVARRGGRLHVALSAFAPLPPEAVRCFSSAIGRLAARVKAGGAWHIDAGTLWCVRQEGRALYAGVQFDSGSLQELCKGVAEAPELRDHAASVDTSGTYAITLADGPEGRVVHLADFDRILEPHKFPLLRHALGRGAAGGSGDAGGEWRQQLAALRWHLCLVERLLPAGQGGTAPTGAPCVVRRASGASAALF